MLNSSWLAPLACAHARFHMEEMEACLGGQKPDYVFQLEQYEKRALAYDAEIVAELEAMELQLKVGVGEDQLGRRFCCLFVCNECTEFDPEGLCLHCGLVGFRCADSCVRYARCGGGLWCSVCAMFQFLLLCKLMVVHAHGAACLSRAGLGISQGWERAASIRPQCCCGRDG